MPFFGITGVVYGVLIGSALHFWCKYRSLRAMGLCRVYQFITTSPNLKKWSRFPPRTITLSASSIALVALIALASRLGEGSIAIFNFSFNLQSAPLSIIGVSYSVAAFPTLARLFAGGARERFVEHHRGRAPHHILVNARGRSFSLFCARRLSAWFWGRAHLIGLIRASRPPRLPFFRFAFSAITPALLVRGYYASGRTTAPLIINIFFSGTYHRARVWFAGNFFALSEGFRFFIESLLRIEDLSGTSIVMLPLAYTIGMIINAILLWGAFGRDFKEFSLSLERAFVQSFAASIIMGFVAYRVLGILGDTFNINTFRGIFAEAFWAATIQDLWRAYLCSRFWAIGKWRK